MILLTCFEPVFGFVTEVTASLKIPHEHVDIAFEWLFFTLKLIQLSIRGKCQQLQVLTMGAIALSNSCLIDVFN
jgi:hypothetical protein